MGVSILEMMASAGGEVWHPFGVHHVYGRLPGVASQTPQPPATVWQPVGLKTGTQREKKEKGAVSGDCAKQKDNQIAQLK